MITIKEDRLIIELEHPLPKELHNDLKLAIINVLELPALYEITAEEYQNSKNSLLFLLKALVRD